MGIVDELTNGEGIDIMGRPSKYESHVIDHLDKVREWKMNGMTDKQIGHKLGISYLTVINYKREYPEFASAIHNGRTDLIEQLEQTLYTKALGGYIVKKRKVTKSDNEDKKDKIEEWEETLAPDTGALVFSLKNLSPEDWQDRRVVDAQFPKEIKDLQQSVANFGRVDNEVH